MHRGRNRAVVDTSVLVSAFAFGGIPRQAVKKAFKECDLYVSRELLTEYRDVPVALAGSGENRSSAVQSINCRHSGIYSKNGHCLSEKENKNQ